MAWRTALITGGSSGIGLALAHGLAERGYHLILVAKSASRLEQASLELRAKHAVAVETVAMDLAIPGAAKRLLERADQEAWFIDVLVANAGWGAIGAYESMPSSDVSDMIHVNIASLAELTHGVIPAMRRQGWGRVLLVGSMAGLLPGPGMALYYATKAFVWSFGQALAKELQGSGVALTTVLPGPTATDFGRRMGLSEQSLRWVWWRQSSEAVAKAAIHAMEQGSEVCVPGLWNRLFYTVVAWLPRRLARYVIYRAQLRLIVREGL